MKVDQRIVDEVTAYAEAAVAICKKIGVNESSAHAGEIMELIAKKSAQAQSQK
jgi:hypothetical protein